jgi:hypothetical protein
MQEFNSEFKNYLLRSHPASGGEIFEKINDALKLQPFLRKRNNKRFERFYQDFLVDHGKEEELIPDVIIDIADPWIAAEISQWHIGEQFYFLEYAWKCKDYRRKMKKIEKSRKLQVQTEDQ